LKTKAFCTEKFDWIKTEFSNRCKIGFGSLLTKSSDLSNLQTPVSYRL